MVGVVRGKNKSYILLRSTGAGILCTLHFENRQPLNKNTLTTLRLYD